MGYVIRMPQLGMSMEEGTVLEWNVGEGDPVEEGEVVAVIESEKTSVDVEAREEGTLGRILVGEGATVEPGDPIGVLLGPDETVADYENAFDLPTAAAPDATDTETTAGGRAAERTGGGSRRGESGPEVRATPGARKLAEEEGVDLSTVEGTGPQGVVTDDDVARAAESAGSGTGDDDSGTGDVRATPGARRLAEEEGIDLSAVEGTGPQGVITDDDVTAHAEAGAGDVEDAGRGGGATRTVVESSPLSGMQRTIADRLGESYREAVHVTLDRSFDAGALRDAASAADAAGLDVSMTDLLIEAAGVALVEHPAFNATFEDGEHRRIEEVNVGVAVDVDRGLVTPVIADVAGKSAEEVAEIRRKLTERVRSDAFTMDDLEGGTFTVSNLGPLGVDAFDPIVNPPQIAILGVGRLQDDGSMTLSLSFDHRVVNGADAARFLDTLVGAATDPGTLAGFFDADIAVEPGRAEETRDVSVESPEGLSGSYRVAGSEVAFDEPTDMGGSGLAPTPVEHLLGALGSCLTLSLRAMARRDGVEVGRVGCEVSGTPESGPLESIEIALSVESDADEGALDRAVTKAERACYVERALSEELDVSVTWSRA